jgi:FKBP-type peptidyl-prolyl cis-trans isomerase FkpA
MMKSTIYSILILCGFAVNVNAQNSVTTTPKGVECQVIGQSTGEKIKPNDVITFQVIQKTDRDSTLFNTYMQGHPVKVQVHASTNPGDLMDVFPLLADKDSAIVKVPVDSIFKGHEEEMPPFFKKGGTINFNVKIVKVQSLAEAIAERNETIAKQKANEGIIADAYIKSHGLTPVTTASGLKYLVTVTGTKPKPAAGDTVYVNYTGRTLDGKVFDTSVEADAKAGGVYNPDRPYGPINFAVGTQRVIAGWDEGLMLLNEGSKATFIVPSDLAYGEQGSGPNIGPNSTLLFDVELVKVVHIKHATATPTVKAPLKKTPLKRRAVTKKKN